MKKQIFATCFILLSVACTPKQTTESTAIILDERNMTDHTGTDFDLSAQVLKWDFILLEQNDSCRLTAMTPKGGFSTESPGRTAITVS